MLVSDGRFTTQLDKNALDLETHIRPRVRDEPGLAEVDADARRHPPGLESGRSWTIADYEAIRADADSRFPWRRDRVEALRQIKDEDEIAAIREAIDYAERAFAHAPSRPADRARREKDVAELLEGYLRRCGATGASFPPIVAVGVRSALPHARPTPTTRIGDDDFVLIDWGATGRPYKSDLTRVLVTGKVTTKFETVYRTVLAAQERGIAAIRPGVKAHDVDAEARSVIEEAGFGRFFDHGLGHGLGMDIHEAPGFAESPTHARAGDGRHGRARHLSARLGRHPDRGRCAGDPRGLRGPDPRSQVARLGAYRNVD